MSEASEILLEMQREEVNGLAFLIKVQAIVILFLAFFICQLETRVNSMRDKIDTLTLCNRINSMCDKTETLILQNGKVVPKEEKCTK